MEKIRNNLKIILLLFMAALAAVTWQAVFYFESHKNLLVTFFDVGQGDAVFIENAGNQILIDGGPGDRILSKLGRRMPFWDRSLDLLILTHPDADHLNGLLEVLKHYQVGMVLDTGVEHSTPQYKEWRETLQKREVAVVVAERGQRVDAGRGVIINILAPFEKVAGTSVPKINNTSVIGRLTHGENSFLLTGDIEGQTELRLLFESPETIDSDILKVAHHGSKTSSREEFLKAVSPKVAVVQVGRKNRYGHPTQEVLDRLAAVGAKIFRNDLDGDIGVESDGFRFWIIK